MTYWRKEARRLEAEHAYVIIVDGNDDKGGTCFYYQKGYTGYWHVVGKGFLLGC